MERLARARGGDPGALEELRPELLGIAIRAARRAGCPEPEELAESAVGDVLLAVAHGRFQGGPEQLGAYVRQTVSNRHRSAWRSEVRCRLGPRVYEREVRDWAESRRQWLEQALSERAPELPSPAASDRILTDLATSSYAEFVRYYRAGAVATSEAVASPHRRLDLSEFGIVPSPRLIASANLILHELRSELEHRFGARAASLDDATESGTPLADLLTEDGRESPQTRGVEVSESRERFWRAYFRACGKAGADVDWLLALCKGLLELPSEQTAAILGIEGPTCGNVVDQRWKRAKDRLGDWLARDDEFRDAVESLRSGASDGAENTRR